MGTDSTWTLFPLCWNPEQELGQGQGSMAYWDSNNRGLAHGRIATLNNEWYAVLESASFKKHPVYLTVRPFLNIPELSFVSLSQEKRTIMSSSSSTNLKSYP
jgi:hypothetical protein